jgi:hypothetical protein
MSQIEFKNTEEFRNYVISEAKKHLFSFESGVKNKDKKPVKEELEPIVDDKISITPDEIDRLAEEIKKINKSIDLRNPLISEGEEDFVGQIMKKTIRERNINVDEINKEKHIEFKNESEKNKWDRLLNYNTLKSDDDERKK